jgi:hypothetical protein
VQQTHRARGPLASEPVPHLTLGGRRGKRHRARESDSESSEPGAIRHVSSPSLRQ